MSNKFKENLIKIIISVVYVGVIVIIYNSLRSEWDNIYNYAEAFGIGGATLVLFSLALIMGNLGAFTTWGYLFGGKRRYGSHTETLAEYTERRMEKSKSKKLDFLPFFIVGALFVIISIIMEI